MLVNLFTSTLQGSSGYQRLFKWLLQYITEYRIANKDIYNFNETGFVIEISVTAKVIYSSNCTGKSSLIQPKN